MTRRRPATAAPADAVALDLFAADAPPPAALVAIPPAPPRDATADAPTEDASADDASAAAGAAGESEAAPRRRRRAASRPALDELGPGFADVPGASAASAVPVSVLTATAKDLLEGAFLPLWVRGEVTDFKAHRNGHWYFSLRDHAAQMRCVVWGRDQRGIPAPPDDGMEITALGQVTVYAARGEMQLSVKAMEAAGDGLWRKALDLALARLQADGLLAVERKRPLPRFPRRVAVVTSPSGAALHDIVAVARRRWAAVEIILVPAKVQGDGAADELCAAIELAGRYAPDVVIVGRGGGGRDDLWAFNDERVARAVANCPVPTVSAVGHEVDVTLCDLVADVRAATPSAAAEAVVPVHRDVAAGVRRLADRLLQAMGLRIMDAADERRRLADALLLRADRVVERRQAAVRELAARLHALSPLATLGRGYAVALDDAGRTLASAAAFAPGRDFGLLLRDGRVRATTLSVAAPDAGAPTPSTGTVA